MSLVRFQARNHRQQIAAMLRANAADRDTQVLVLVREGEFVG
ncbi:hypothetical protein [Mycobacterium intracellulare]|nr:hypothetical protein [Mycobacterium intracellulare]